MSDHAKVLEAADYMDKARASLDEWLALDHSNPSKVLEMGEGIEVPTFALVSTKLSQLSASMRKMVQGEAALAEAAGKAGL